MNRQNDSFDNLNIIERNTAAPEICRRNKTGGVIKVLIAIVLILLTLVVGATAAMVIMHQSGKKKMTTANESVTMQSQTHAAVYDEGKTLEYKGQRYVLNENLVTIACVGIDRREFGLVDGAVGTAGQADTVMLLAFDTQSGKTTVVSVPRDTMVDVNLYTADGAFAGVEKNQLCLAFAYGDGKETSCENVVNSLERLFFGMPVTAYVAFELDGIPNLNDAVGGIALTALETVHKFTAGKTVTLYGEDALAYVRQRNSDRLDADALRRNRQIQYIKAFAEKAISAVKNDFSVLSSLYEKALAYSCTDITFSDVSFLASTFLANNASFGNFVSIPGEYVANGNYAEFYADEEALFELIVNIYYLPEVTE